MTSAAALSDGSIRRAPVVAVVAYNLEFYHKLEKLMPFRDLNLWFSDPKAAAQSGTLQGGNLILAARALGLDGCPRLDFEEAVRVI